jgi:hypothetical protein
MTSYINPWYKPGQDMYGPKEFTTDVKPTEYKGYLIYERIQGQVWDVVKDGRCVSQRAGINGAKQKIDEILGEN